MSRRIQILDTTLRDGEQSPGIALQPHEKAEIAEQLERLGVDVVEAGFPGASPGDFEGVRAVAAAVRGPVVAGFARTRREDIEAAGQALAGARRSRIHLVLATSALHMEKKLRLDPEDVVRQARWAVEFAGERADASFIEDVRRRCPELRDVTLSVHCHDDLGLSVANSLAGIHAGADQVEGTINGLGERAGNASLEEIVVALKVRSDYYEVETGIDTTLIAATSRLVAERTGYAVQRNKAVVGANAFAHEAGIHQDGMLKDSRTYQIIDPREVGVSMTLPLGKHSGRHAFAHACAEMGVALEGEELNLAFHRFKALADSGAAVTLDELFTEVAV